VDSYQTLTLIVMPMDSILVGKGSTGRFWQTVGVTSYPSRSPHAHPIVIAIVAGRYGAVGRPHGLLEPQTDFPMVHDIRPIDLEIGCRLA
jgi:hypothetical protein